MIEFRQRPERGLVCRGDFATAPAEFVNGRNVVDVSWRFATVQPPVS